MIYKSVSAKAVIAKAQMSFQLSGTNWQDWALEWIGDALRAIGNSAGTKDVDGYKIKIKHHKGNLPCDLLELKNVSYKGSKLVLGIKVGEVDSCDEYYQIKDLDYITTSFEEGEIEIDYTAYPTDDKGYPLVPDTFQHIEACQYFILFKLCSGGYKHNVWDVKSALDMWNEFSRKASNKKAFPSIDSMHSFKNMWVRQVADVSASARNFAGSQGQQVTEGI